MARTPRAASLQSLRAFVRFGLKQASACLFGAFLLTMIVVTRFWYPFEEFHRYDVLFLSAVGFQIVLLMTRLESLKEAGMILVFHVMATLMELFKTSEGINSWSYPEPFSIGIGNVPFFAGFMYSAVGSYIARTWRMHDFRFSRYPPVHLTILLAALIYVNFFSHHFIADCRWPLLLGVVALFGRVTVSYRIWTHHRSMPLLLGWGLVALFIWIAENVATFATIWVYPSQHHGWGPVHPAKIVSWFLLMILSFVLVSMVKGPRTMGISEEAEEGVRPRFGGTVPGLRDRG